jgi:hypothetical protein
MYTETEFMDMSLSSRIEKLKTEVSKLIEWFYDQTIHLVDYIIKFIYPLI